MPILLIACLGSSIFGGSSFFENSIFGLDLMTLLILVTLFYYCFSVVKIARKRVRITTSMKWLISFLVWAVVIVVLSIVGIAGMFSHDSLLIDRSYIPRQAYYLFFFPLAIVVPLIFQGSKVIDFAIQHSSIVAFIIYVSFVVANQTFALSVGCTLILEACILISKRHTVSSYLLLAIIMISPIGEGGESTKIILRIAFVLFFFAKANSKAIPKAFLRVVFITVALTFVSGIFATVFSVNLDPNSNWRLNYWADEISMLLQTYGLGAGYGTSYASLAFAGDSLYSGSGPFAPEGVYTAMEKLFVVGSHNSFVSIAFRLGIPGILLFIQYLRTLGKEITLSRSASDAMPFLFGSIIIVVMFNVGIESPGYFFIFLFVVTLCECLTSKPFKNTQGMAIHQQSEVGYCRP